MNRRYEIRDPLYGFIELDSWEREIIDHPAFQRLRRIKQLAWTDMVYPGATHTRFEHSLGVMHLATEMYEKIVEKNRSYLVNRLGYDESGLRIDRKFVRLAALLHDVGHPPFSHAGEGVMDTNPATEKPYKHEHYTAAMVQNEFKDVIENHTFNQNHHIQAKDIGKFLLGGAGLGRRLLWRGLVSGQVDADRADYLLRDSYHIGVSYGNYDLKRLLVTLTIAEHPETDAPLVAVEEGGLHAAEALIIARYLMFTQVYFHRTRRVYDHHLARAMRALLRKKFDGKRETFLPPTTPENIEDYISWDDWRVLGLLSQGEGGKDGDVLKERKHHRCVFDTSEVPSETDLDQSEKVLKQLSELQPFVDEPTTSWYSGGESDIMIARENGKVQPLTTFRGIVEGLLPIRQRRIYVSLKNQSKAESLLKEG